MKRQEKRSLTATLFLSSALSSGMIFLPSTVYAQDQEKLEEVIVTGSNLPTTPDAVATRVSTVDSEQMAQEGANTNMLEVLRKALPVFAGRSNTGNSNANNNNQNTAGGSQMQLRNLDTLVLIDGRRVAVSAIEGVNGKQFVDVNQIPAAAIDRVEVVTDGSSAVYGSDAVGGVVNIIMKTDYNGGEIGTRLGAADGGYTERSGYLVLGQSFGNLSITATASNAHTDPLFQKNRSFDQPLHTIPAFDVPGTIISGSNAYQLAPGLNSPADKNPTGAGATASSLAALVANGTYDPTTKNAIYGGFPFAQYQTLLLRQDQNAGTINFTDKLLGEKLVLFGTATYERSDSFTQWLPINTSLTVPAGSPYDPLTTGVSGVNFADLSKPKQFTDSAETVRLVAGLRGELDNDWTWEAAYVHSENTLDQAQANSLFTPNLALAIAGGYDANGNAVAGGAYSRVYSGFSKSGGYVIVPALNPFATGGYNPATLSTLYGTEHISTLSYLNSFDAKLVGSLFELPAGKPGFAVGLQVRQEGLAGKTDANGANSSVPGRSCVQATQSCQQWFNNQGTIYADPFNQIRIVSSGFIETRVPITGQGWNAPGLHALDVIGAVRTDHYSDFGWSTVPKISLRWQPIDREITIRASESKSFTAPTLYSVYGPTQVSSAAGTILNTATGIPSSQLAFPSFTQESYGNHNLKPVKSLTRSLSATVTPSFIPNLTLVGEYSTVGERGFVGGSGVTTITQSVNQLGSASPYVSQLAMNAFPGQPGAVYFTSPGQLKSYLLANPANAANLYAADPFRNLGIVQVRASSLSGNYDYLMDEWGILTLGTNATFFNSFKFQAPGNATQFQYAGTATNSGPIGGTLPRYRFYSTINWAIDQWNFLIGDTYIDGVTDEGTGGPGFFTSTTLKPIPVKSYNTVDLRIAYDLKGPLMNDFGKGMNIAFGINNVQNRMPPAAPQAFTDNNADVATYSPIGRLFYLQSAIKF